MEKRKWFIAACLIVLVFGGHVRGQSSSIVGYGFTAPVLAPPGSIVSVCAFDWLTAPFVAGPITVSEEVLDVPLNAAVASQSITLPISAIAPNQPTVCVKHTVPAAATSPAGPGELVSGAIVVFPPPGTSSETLPPPLLTASINISGNSVQTLPIAIQSTGMGLGSASRGFR